MTGRAAALSLGAGVQSTAVLLLSLAGDLPPFDAVVFADTGDEPAAVYAHLDRLRAVAPVVTVTAGHLAASAATSFVPVPLFDGRGGMGRRQCTTQYKIRPIRRYLRTLGRSVDLAVCISTDEVHRAKDSRVAWCRNVFPLLDLGWSRGDCLDYLAEAWPTPVPRSACVYCPLHSDREWLDLRDNHPADWATAVDFDESARRYGYVHRSGRPLALAILRPEDAGQMVLECEGMCGL